ASGETSKSPTTGRKNGKRAPDSHTPSGREEISALKSDADSDEEGAQEGKVEVKVDGNVEKKETKAKEAEELKENRVDGDNKAEPTEAKLKREKPPTPPPVQTKLEPPKSAESQASRASKSVSPTPGGQTNHGAANYANEPYMQRKQKAWIERIAQLEEERQRKQQTQHIIGKVLDTRNVVDRNISFLASNSTNISLRWQQGKFLGGGSFGSVYMAINLETADLMAVKEIRFQDVTSLEALQRSIKDEMTVLQLLHHPNIVEYYGVEVRRDKLYIFMEYCPHSVAGLLEHGRFEDEPIVKIYAKQMLKGLEYLHGQGIVHRDVKPANTLFGQEGQIKFVDFGASKIYKSQKTVVVNGEANTLVGTPHYIAPEVITGETVVKHGAQDIWSLGCCILEMVTGRKPWSSLDNEWAVMYHIGMSNRHPPLPEPNQLSDDGIDFLRQCFTRPANDRPTAEELLEHPWVKEVDETNADLTALDPLKQAAEAAAAVAAMAEMQEMGEEGRNSQGSWMGQRFGGPSPVRTPSDENVPLGNSTGYGFPAPTKPPMAPPKGFRTEGGEASGTKNHAISQPAPTGVPAALPPTPSAVVKAVAEGIEPSAFPSPAVSSAGSSEPEMAWHGALMRAVADQDHRKWRKTPEDAGTDNQSFTPSDGSGSVGGAVSASAAGTPASSGSGTSSVTEEDGVGATDGDASGSVEEGVKETAAEEGDAK
ncbi:Suppressor of Sensor Kinase (SLN1), partial [Rhizophlyctis rosea]